MRNKGVLIDCRIKASSTANSDTIIVSIRCEDRREGVVIDTGSKTKTFFDRAHMFIPSHGGFEFRVACNKIEGWLVNMGVDSCSHHYVIDCILKQCSSCQVPKWGSIVLDVHVEIADQYSYVPKQPRLHPRDEHDDSYEYESACYERDLKKCRMCPM